MGYFMSPLQTKIKFTKLMRTGFILLLIGFSISLIPSISVGFLLAGMYSGGYMMYYFFYIIGIFGGTILTGVGSLLSLSGYIILLIAFSKISQVSNNPEFKRKSKITVVLFIVTLSINFLFNTITLFTGGMYSFLYSFMYSLYGYGLSGISGYFTLVVSGLFISCFILLSLSMKELKMESQVGRKGIIAAFIYPVIIIPQIFQLFDFGYYDFMILIVVSIVGSVVEFIVLIILSSEGLVASSKIFRSFRTQGIPAQNRFEPTLSPQQPLPPTKKGGNFCIKCGIRLVENARFCGSCGHPVE